MKIKASRIKRVAENLNRIADTEASVSFSPRGQIWFEGYNAGLRQAASAVLAVIEWEAKK